MYRTCQVCGNPIFSANDYGMDADGSLNADYCSNCYKSGHFYARDYQEGTADPLPLAFAVTGRNLPGLSHNGINIS